MYKNYIMTQEEIDGNNLIAIFLGWELNSDSLIYRYYRQYDKFLWNPLTGNERAYHQEQLAFHVSYEWIMLAWIKFRSLNWYGQDYCSAYSHTHRYFIFILSSKLVNGSITEMFNELVEAIKWYNTTT